MFSLFQRDTGKAVHVNEIDAMLKDIVLIDIREPQEFAGGSIRSAKNIPMGRLLNNPDKFLDKNKTYYIMCQSGGRSSQTVSILHRAGYDVVNVKGGMSSYTGDYRSR